MKQLNPCKRRQSLRSRSAERGAALVEFAVVLPLLMAMVLGMLDFGVSLTNFNSVRQGTREGARRAVVGDVGGYTACPVSGAASGSTLALVCLTKQKIGLDEASTRVSITFDASHAEGEALIICTQYPLQSVTGMYGFLLDGKMLRAQVDMRVERTSVGGTPISLQSFQEGGGWAWCG